jgi:hypothetical protein
MNYRARITCALITLFLGMSSVAHAVSFIERVKAWARGGTHPAVEAAAHPGMERDPRPEARRAAKVDRVARWQTVVKALRASGIGEDSEEMRWALKNLHRAEHWRMFPRKHHPGWRKRVHEREQHQKERKEKEERKREEHKREKYRRA